MKGGYIMSVQLSFDFDVLEDVEIIETDNGIFLGDDALQIVTSNASVSDLLASINDGGLMFELLFNKSNSIYSIVQRLWTNTKGVRCSRYYLVRNIARLEALMGGDTQ